MIVEKCLLKCALLLAVLCTGAAHGVVIYVDDSAVGGANNGTSWPNAFVDLQSALAIAHGRDEIRIGQGVYKPAPPNGPREATFNLVSAVIMQGGYAGFGASDPDANDPEVFVTTLSGDIDALPSSPEQCGNDSYHVTTGRGLSRGTTLRGVTIRNGCAHGDEDYIGGGMSILGPSELSLVDCAIVDNNAFYGAGMQIGAGCALMFQNCQFINNRIPYPAASGGGAVLCQGSAEFVACTFVANAGAQYGGAIWAAGNMASVNVRHCIFRANGAEDGGAIRGAGTVVDCMFDHNGALYGGAMQGGAFIVNCIFRGNSAGEEGGALDRPGTIIGCLFVGNECSGTNGGAISDRYMSTTAFPIMTLMDCTFAGNRLSQTLGVGAAIYAEHARVNARNCIFWDNRTVDATGESAQFALANGATLQIDNSCIQGWTGSLGGSGNHGNDPRFIDADGPDNIYGTEDDNARLQPNSPCIDSGDRSLLPPDAFDLDRDGDTTEPLPFDLDFRPRIAGSNVDMGAFEFHGHTCRADIDGNGSVGVSDLLAVLTGWGNCASGSPCPADLDLNMCVNVDDLLNIITHWGPCP